MEAKELRIGNYVNEQSDSGEPQNEFIIAAINALTGTVINTEDSMSQLDYLAPIPLTEEWLLKLGFSKMTIKPLWRKTIGEYTLESEDFLFDFKSKHIYADSGLTLHPIGNEIKYVHQLQNLYFALTGQELTLTPAKEMK